MESKIHPVEHSYFEQKKIMTQLRALYPFMEVQTVGKTAAGREIKALFIGQGEDYTVLLSGANAGFRLGPLLLLRFAEELCNSMLTGREFCGINIRKAIFRRGVLLIPNLNPDGAEIALRGAMGCGYLSEKISEMCNGEYSKWRANLRGVELFGNFKGNFEALQNKAKSKPAASGFYGYRAESEPETVSLIHLLNQTPTRAFLEIAAPGETVLYTGSESNANGSSRMAEVLAGVSGFTVTPPLGRPKTEICDYFATHSGQPGFCVKIGNETIPQVSQLESWYFRLREMLVLFALM